MQSTQTPTTTISNSKLKDFFVDQLKDIYWAEKKLVKTLPKLAEAAHSVELSTAFSDHLEETKNHVNRLEQVFDLIGEPAKAEECPALKGIAEEGENIINETDEQTAQRDVGLIFAGQKAEHYEIATYGGLLQLARTMKLSDGADLLNETLQEEKKANEKLTQLAEGGINENANMEISDRD